MHEAQFNTQRNARESTAVKQSNAAIQYNSLHPSIITGLSENSIPDRIMRIPEQSFLQRKCADCEKGEKLHRKPLTESITPFIQAKRYANAENINASITSNIQGNIVQLAPSPTPTKPVIDYRYGIGNNDDIHLYDAELNRKIDTLTLIMKINFSFSDTDATQVWPDEPSKQKFVDDFIRTVESRWSYRFFIVPDGVCDEPTQKFKARVRVEPVKTGEHFKVDVKYTIGHKRESSGTTKGSHGNRADLHSGDNQQEGYLDLTPPREEFLQSSSEHEFGHMLGLHHINIKGTGDDYGETKEQKKNIMGHGHIITEENYTPFTTAMYYFTGCNWKASQK